MNAAETIAAAIEKLQAQRDGAFAGPWKAFHSGVANGDHSYVVADHESIAYISANDGIDEEYRAPTADLIVTLHRTIDAQLRSMRAALTCVRMGRGGEPVGVALDLARAILGEAS